MGTSTLITRMTSDINQVQSGLNLFLRLFLRSPFVVVGAMIKAFTVNVRAAWIFVVAIPLLERGGVRRDGHHQPAVQKRPRPGWTVCWA